MDSNIDRIAVVGAVKSQLPLEVERHDDKPETKDKRQETRIARRVEAERGVPRIVVRGVTGGRGKKVVVVREKLDASENRAPCNKLIVFFFLPAVGRGGR